MTRTLCIAQVVDAINSNSESSASSVSCSYVAAPLHASYGCHYHWAAATCVHVSA